MRTRHVILPGQTYGSWTVVAEVEAKRYACGNVHRMIHLRCGCGDEHVRSIFALLNGSKNCRKCFTRKNRVNAGDRFGSLVVLDPDAKGYKGRRGRYAVHARCDCGAEKLVSFGDLISGHVSSCGCRWNQKGPNSHSWRGHEEIPGTHFKHIRNGARVRSIEFSITLEEIWALFLAQDRKCALSGMVLSFGADTTASLDRIDSSMGYIAGNLQWVHKDLNIMKKDHSTDEFVEWCRKVVHHADSPTIEQIR